ncbi:MAG: hypothetical protein ACREO4_16350 [Lysobacter sp.]
MAWPFATGGQISERYEWLTDGMSPAYGMEYTDKLRQDPRVVLAFDGLESGANRRWMENDVAMWAARRWHVPLVCDKTTTSSFAEAADEAIGVDTQYRRFVAGGNAMLVVPGEPRRAEMVEILAVDAESISLADPLAADWPMGSIIMPTIAGWLEKTPQFGRFTGDAAPYAVAFRAAEPMILSADFGAPTYRDAPVFEQPVYWTQDPGYAPERRIDTLDDGIGPILLHDQGGMVLPRIQVEVTMVGAAEIAAHRALLAAMAGRHHPIWVPSFTADFHLVAAASSTALDVAWGGFARWPLEGNRRDIRIDVRGGTPVYRRLAAATDMGAGIERLVLDEALPVGFAADSVAAISLMALCRQEADVNSLRPWAHGVMQSQLAFVGCRHGL